MGRVTGWSGGRVGGWDAELGQRWGGEEVGE